MTAPRSASPGVAIVHLMKTGGTSIDKALRSQLQPSEWYPEPGDAAAASGQKVNPDVLLTLPVEQRAALRFVSVHMPAWVIEVAVPHLPSATMLRHPVDRTVSHLRQLARTSRSGQTLDDLWEHPPIHRRLANYQTQVFAATEADFVNRPRITRLDPDTTDEQKAALIDEVLAAKETGLGQVIELNDDAYRSAVERLETIDVVGVTDDLSGFSTRLASRTGLALPEIGHENRATDDTVASASLRARIARDNQFDLALYKHATTLGTARTGR